MSTSSDVELVALRTRDHDVLADGMLEKQISEDDVQTDSGMCHIVVQGTPNKPAIITYHDIGLNSYSNFHGFFSFSEMQHLLKHFSVYHVNAPGQESGAATLPQDYSYPDMVDLAKMISSVMKYYHLKTFIGFGVGAGANILCRFAVSHPNMVNALCLINPTSTTCGWGEWAYQKYNLWALRSHGITDGVQDYLCWHHFGSDPPEYSNDVISTYRDYFKKLMNPTNLALFIESYIRRPDMGIKQVADISGTMETVLKCPTLLITSIMSPRAGDVEEFFSRISPSLANIIKLSDCSAAVLEEEPGKVVESFRLFLQGQGYIPTLTQVRPAFSRSSSQDSDSQVFHVRV